MLLLDVSQLFMYANFLDIWI